jgi:uncharacterized membrane protein
LNGALMALGAMAVVDNVIAHWLLDLHRAIPGPYALHVEIALIAIGAAMFTAGFWRERRMHRRLISESRIVAPD